MEEIVRRRNDADVDFWYHGTNEYFGEWGQPPIVPKYKKRLVPHSFISLTKDRNLAEEASQTTKGLCRAKIAPDAKVLNLTKKNTDTRAQWELVVKSEYGAQHELIKDYDSYIKACISGEVLRMHTSDPIMQLEFRKKFASLNNENLPNYERAIIFIGIQNFTRILIETVISPALEFGFDAVICAEIDRYRNSGPKACLNLYAFTPLALTTPEWIIEPNESLMPALIDEVKESGAD